MKPAYTEARPLVRRLSLIVPTKRSPQFIDITAEVQRKVAESGVQEGLALLFCRHTTAAVRINENEPLLIHDMEEFLKRVAPRDLYYRHNDFGIRTDNMTEDECPNAHAHCQHLLLGASEMVPVEDGRLLLGQWQRVFLVELDRPRDRIVDVQVMGR
ncbi:MAG: secondary thiamine-phosphate synthase enzyme YjbQ [Candidatus Bipolaricaulaceae bacterium]